MELNSNIEDYDLVFLDLETTGLDAVLGDSICEIGAYRVKKRKIINKFHSLINPETKVSEEALRIHKIPLAELSQAPVFEEVADEFMAFTDDSVVCAYNVDFDLGFIRKHLRACGRPSFDLPAVDILSMARDALNLSKYNLESAAGHFNIDTSQGLHRALDDAYLAYQVFFGLVELFGQKNIRKLSDFISLYGWENEAFNTVEGPKVARLQKACEEKTRLKISYFPRKGNIIEEEISPLRIFQEKKYSYLLYQGQGQNASRLDLRRILTYTPAV